MKKYFFVVTSAIQIILLLIVIANVPHIVEEQMKAIEESQALISSMFEEVNTSTKSNDIDVPKEQVALESNFFNDFISKEYLERIFYFSAILIIIFNLVIIEIASSKNILKHRARVITYLLISMLLGINIWINLISLIECIVLATMKRENPEDYPEKAKKVEPLPYEYFDLKNKIKAIIMILTYTLLHFVVPVLINSFAKDFSLSSTWLIISAVLDFIIFGVAIYLYKDELKEGFKALKENYKGYRKFILIMLLISYASLFFFNIIRIIVTGNPFSENQAGLNSLPILYIGVLAVLWAPFVEELVFRASIRRFIKNKYIFIVISAIVFGTLHAISEDGAFNIIISSLPYVALGACLATSYARSNNVLTNIAQHAINNFIAVVLMALVFGI